MTEAKPLSAERIAELMRSPWDADSLPAQLLATIAALTKERDEEMANAFKWNVSCAALRVAVQRYIKRNFTTGTAKKAEIELLERSEIFFKDAGQNLLDRLAQAEESLAVVVEKARVVVSESLDKAPSLGSIEALEDAIVNLPASTKAYMERFERMEKALETVRQELAALTADVTHPDFATLIGKCNEADVECISLAFQAATVALATTQE